ncbi:hypothetical protein T439DRAFT_379619 [Meredithblackwellia eburnea MCA 4105]
MGIVCSAIASVFAAIGNAIMGLFSLIARFLNAIVGAITSVFVGIFDCLGSVFCCGGGRRARSGGMGRRRV